MKNMNWRLIIDNEKDAATNMAIDEAILKTRKTPTLRFYQWKPAAVSVGYFQSIDQEINKEYCKKHNIDIVRRITGGGAVFHDKELTYSFICNESFVPTNIIKSYELICGTIVKGIRNLKINAEFHPINDILVNNKKISGSAQTRKNNTLLQHGTIIIDINLNKMFSVLKVPDEKIKDKMIKDVRERVTSLKELNIKDINIIRNSIIKAFEKEFNIRFIQGKLLKQEQNYSEKLKKKFKSNEWNYSR